MSLAKKTDTPFLFFCWCPGQMRPVTRMKEKNIERKPSFWDKKFANEEE